MFPSIGAGLSVELLTVSLEKLTLSKPEIRFNKLWNCNHCGERQFLAQFAIESGRVMASRRARL